MVQVTFDNIQVGDSMPGLNFGPVTRHTLALYCGGSGDHNPVHVDIDFAKKAGLPDVIAHGALSMAVLGRALTEWVGQEQVRSYSVRFAAMTHVHDTVKCRGRVVKKYREDNENRICLELETETQPGVITLTGTAVIALP